MVVIAAVVQSLLEAAPLIFLRESETVVSQTDVLFTGTSSSTFTTMTTTNTPSSGSSTVNISPFLNYTRIQQALQRLPNSEEYSYHSPRISIRSSLYKRSVCDDTTVTTLPATISSNNWMYYTTNGKLCGSVQYGGVTSCIALRCRSRNTGSSTGGGGGSKSSSSSSLLPSTPASINDQEFTLVDSAKELRAGIGRLPLWDSPQYPYIPVGEVIVPASVGKTLNLGVGDDIIAVFRLPYNLLRSSILFSPSNASYTGWYDRITVHNEVAVPLRIHAVAPTLRGKFAAENADNVVLVEYGTFYNYLIKNMHPRIRSEIPSEVSNPSQPSKLYEYATEVRCNLSPSSRIAAYRVSNFDTVRGSIAKFASTVVYSIGFSEIDSTLPIVSNLEVRRFVSLYLGILLDILLFVLFLLSTVLIYSLLLINVSKRTFEIAVRRMLGSSKLMVVGLLLCQAASYSFPAWVSGLLFAQAVAGGSLSTFAKSSGIAISTGLTSKAISYASILATAIPLVASIGPIRIALGPTIRDALDMNRPKANIIQYNVERAEDNKLSWTLLFGGMGVFCLGFAVYFGLPLSLLSLNLGLLASLFISILLAMLGGLVTLMLGIELYLSKFMLYLSIGWWESFSIVSLAMGNLVAHRPRNRKTILMYALSVAFIALIMVVAEQQVMGAAYRQQQRNGAPIVLLSPYQTDSSNRYFVTERGMNDKVVIETINRIVYCYTKPKNLAVVMNRKDCPNAVDDVFIENTAWTTMPFAYTIDTFLSYGSQKVRDGTTTTDNPSVRISSIRAKNIGKSNAWYISPSGIGSSFFGTVDTDGATYELYNIYNDVSQSTETSLSLSDQLYTLRGSQSIIVSSMYKIELALRRNLHMLLETGIKRNGDTIYTRNRLNTLGMMDHASFFIFSRAPRSGIGDGLVSLPTFRKLLDIHATPAIESIPRIPLNLLPNLWERNVRTGGTDDRKKNQTLVSIDILSDPSLLIPLRSSTQSAVSIDDLPLRTLLLNFDTRSGTTNNATERIIDQFKTHLRYGIAEVIAARMNQEFSSLSPFYRQYLLDNLGGWKINDSRKIDGDIAGTIALLNFIFAVLSLVAMILCFFSLFASMAANISEQKHEMGVLRSIGVSRYELLRVYAHEAYALTTAACLSGSIIGIFIAWLFGKQQELFTSVPYPFVFPIGVVLTVFITSAIAAWTAAWIPAKQSLMDNITNLLR